MGNYIIVNTTDKDKINFDEFQENCFAVSRTNVDETKFLLEYDGEIPSSLSTIDSFEGPFGEDDILVYISSSEWIFDVEVGDDYVEPECS